MELSVVALSISPLVLTAFRLDLIAEQQVHQPRALAFAQRGEQLGQLVAVVAHLINGRFGEDAQRQRSGTISITTITHGADPATAAPVSR